MRVFPASWMGRLLPLKRGLLLVVALATPVPCLYGQVAPPDEAQPGTMSALDQASMYPVQSQTAETPNLSALNNNADTTKYADTALTRGPVFFSLDTTAAWATNINQTFDNQPSVSGTYYNVGIPAGLHLWNSLTDFTAYFKGDTSFYPGHAGNNHTSVIYSQQLNHQLSETTTTSWSVAGGHIVELGHYLSPVISVGTTGVLAPQRAGGLQPLNDAATTFSVSHQTSERDSFIAAATAGWFDQPKAGSDAGNPFAYRQLTGGGDFQWQRALNAREIGGVEVANVYIAGLAPGGMANFTSAKLMFGQTLTTHSSLTAGIGPLFSQSAVDGGKNQGNFSYSANASFDYRRISGHVTAGFARLYELSYPQNASTANELYFSFDRALTPKLLLTEDLQYVRSSVIASQINYSQFVSTTRLDMYLTHTLDYHLEASSDIQGQGIQTPGYSDNEISTGITYYFGSPLSRAGVQ
jgi:hypothetical protein